MIKNIAILFIVLFLNCSLNKQFVKSVDSFATTALPDFKEYINKDGSLDSTSKRIRLQTITKFEEMVQKAKETE